VVLAGSRDCFTSGNDLGDFMRLAQGGSAGTSGEIAAPFGFLRMIATFDKPLVAAVAGVAIGIGTTMLLHCDLIYAAPSARFKLPFVDLALVPEAGSSVLLPALVGARRAAQLLLLGEQLDAPTALAWGVISGVVDDPEAAAQAAARRMAAMAPAALRATKGLIRRASRDAGARGDANRERGVRRAVAVARGDGGVSSVHGAASGRLLTVLTRASRPCDPSRDTAGVSSAIAASMPVD